MYICSELSISYCAGTCCLPGNLENPWGQYLPIQASRLTLHICVPAEVSFRSPAVSPPVPVLQLQDTQACPGPPLGVTQHTFTCPRTMLAAGNIHQEGTIPSPGAEGSGRPWLWPQQAHLQLEANATGNKCCLGSPINLRRWKYRKGWRNR